MSDSMHWTRRKVIGAVLATAVAAAMPRRAIAATTLRWATVLARDTGAMLMVVHVEEPPMAYGVLYQGFSITGSEAFCCATTSCGVMSCVTGAAPCSAASM